MIYICLHPYTQMIHGTLLIASEGEKVTAELRKVQWTKTGESFLATTSIGALVFC